MADISNEVTLTADVVIILTKGISVAEISLIV